jgi:signal transduction histidine kinase
MYSDLTLLYPLVILSAGIVATPRQAAGITLLGILIYLVMIAMLSQNMLVEYLPEGKEAGLNTIYPAIAMRVFTFALFGASSIYISKRCGYFRQPDQDVRKTAQTLLENLGVATLVLNRQGEILSANPLACELLRATEQELASRKFPDLCVSVNQSIPDHYGSSAHLVRTDGPPLPVSLYSADITLPAAALNQPKEKQESCSITLLCFSDISHPLDLEHQLRKVERITAATRIAGEIAHEIRTPLTSISASIQLLKHYEEKATAADWLPNSSRKKDRIELFDHITGASEQMDAVIQTFVDFAEFSPDDLLSIIKLDSNPENKGYIGHLNMKAKGLENGQDSDRGRRPDNPQFIE